MLPLSSSFNDLLVHDSHVGYRQATPEQILEAACRVLDQRVHRDMTFTSPESVKTYLCMKLARYEHEVFSVLLLDAQNALIDYVEMFRGTINATAVYPREVVKLALKYNAAAMILCHNHPSGSLEPSRADEHLTQTLKSTLSLVDVRVLDHIVVAGGQTVSFAERGLL